MEAWETIEWTKVQENIEDMSGTVEAFALRCKRMPSKLREFDSYAVLKKTIEDFQNVLPLLQELSKPSIKDRHWRLSGHSENGGGKGGPSGSCTW